MPSRKVTKRLDNEIRRNQRRFEVQLRLLEKSYEEFCKSDVTLTEEEKEAIKVKTSLLLADAPQL